MSKTFDEVESFEVKETDLFVLRLSSECPDNIHKSPCYIYIMNRLMKYLLLIIGNLLTLVILITTVGQEECYWCLS